MVLWRVGGVLDLSGRFDLLNIKAAQKYYRLKYFLLEYHHIILGGCGQEESGLWQINSERHPRLDKTKLLPYFLGKLSTAT